MAKISETKPSLEDIKDDLAARIKEYFQRTNEYFNEKDCEEGQENIRIPSSDNLDVHQFPIGRDIQVYYEYAFEARMPRGCSIENWGNEDGFKKLEEFIIRPIKGEGIPASSSLENLIERVNARYALDNGGRLSIKQIALLAGMTEKSARNAIHADGGNRLEGAATDKSDTFVENHEAKCWLKGRRSFRETIFPEFDKQQPESLSHAEVSKYISEIVHFQYGDEHGEDYVARAAKQLGWENGEERLIAIMKNTSAIRPTDCEALANLIKVDAAWFTEQIMRALFPRQMELSLKSALSTNHQVDASITGRHHETN